MGEVGQAKLLARSWFLSCPKCEAAIPNPNDGSLVWGLLETEKYAVGCSKCGSVVEIPIEVRGGHGK